MVQKSGYGKKHIYRNQWINNKYNKYNLFPKADKMSWDEYFIQNVYPEIPIRKRYTR